MSHVWKPVAIAVLLALNPIGALGQEGSGRSDSWRLSDASRWSIGIAVGYGQRTNPLIHADDLPLVVDLDIAWFGDRWFFDNGDGGFTLVNNERFTLSAVGRTNSDRLFFTRTSIEGLNFGPSAIGASFDPPDRDYALEAGFELLADGRPGFLQAGLFRDVSSTHDGFEVSVLVGRVIRRNRWALEPSLGARYKSSRLNDYYWGLRPDEATPLYPEYRADSGTNGYARLGFNYQLRPEWTFFAVAEYERLSSAIRLSPIVADQQVRGIYAGFGRRF
jgi:outer membrane protein